MLFITSIMAFIWRSGPSSEGQRFFQEGPSTRIAISVVLLLGLGYFIRLVGTFRRYGDLMDQVWRDRILNQWMQPQAHPWPLSTSSIGLPSDSYGQWYPKPTGIRSPSHHIVPPLHTMQEARPSSHHSHDNIAPSLHTMQEARAPSHLSHDKDIHSSLNFIPSAMTPNNLGQQDEKYSYRYSPDSFTSGQSHLPAVIHPHQDTPGSMLDPIVDDNQLEVNTGLEDPKSVLEDNTSQDDMSVKIE